MHKSVFILLLKDILIATKGGEFWSKKDLHLLLVEIKMV